MTPTRIRPIHCAESSPAGSENVFRGGMKKKFVASAASAVDNSPGPSPPTYALSRIGSTNRISAGS